MDWKDVANVVGRSAPILGGLLGGPAGGAIGAIVASALGTSSTPDAVSQALTVNPDAAVKLAEIEKDKALGLAGLTEQLSAAQVAADTAQQGAVNATMQSETKAEHWASWLWRPYMGFVAGTMIFGCYFVLPLLKLPVPTIPEFVWLFLGAVLGTASYFRGKAQADPTNPASVRG